MKLNQIALRFFYYLCVCVSVSEKNLFIVNYSMIKCAFVTKVATLQYVESLLKTEEASPYLNNPV